jgi:arsenical pump membrane protein
MSGVLADVVALALLATVLAFAMAQPRGLPEVTVAVPAAAVAVGLGLVSPVAALGEVRALGPTVGFLAAILVLAYLADAEGVFRWLGERLAQASGGRTQRLLGLVFAAAALTTAVLSLDATVVLLTPVVFGTAARLRLRPKPHVYACTHLANSASTLLPVSNLTNLLAFSTSGLTFLTFAALMGLPWLTAITVEYLVFRRFFRTDLAVAAQRLEPAGTPAPRFAFAVLGATLLGFGCRVCRGGTGVGGGARRDGAGDTGAFPPRGRPRSVAARGVPAVLSVRARARDRRHRGHRPRARRRPGRVDPRRGPPTPSLLGLLAVAGLAAALANVVNNLPATLVMLAALGAAPHPGLVLAVLLGVNIGPNLTYVGSLATLLWRRLLGGSEAAPTLREFSRLGVLTVPASLAVAVLALWLGLTLGPALLP